jgi:hypothetical protein
VNVGQMGIAMSVSWAALAVSLVLAVWGVVLLRGECIHELTLKNVAAGWRETASL